MNSQPSLLGRIGAQLRRTPVNGRAAILIILSAVFEKREVVPRSGSEINVKVLVTLPELS
jgi:hypothetical protein